MKPVICSISVRHSGMTGSSPSTSVRNFVGMSSGDLADFCADCVWPLIGVAEWVMTALSRVMREIILEQANAEWGDSADSSSAS